MEGIYLIKSEIQQIKMIVGKIVSKREILNGMMMIMMMMKRWKMNKLTMIE